MAVIDIPGGAPFDDVCDAFDGPLAEIAGRLNAVHANLVELTEQLLETGAWQQGGKRTPEAFLAWKLGVSPHHGEIIVAAARERQHRPVVMGLFDEAKLSLDQVTETLKAPRWADELVADIAQISTVTKLRRAMRSENFEGDPDEPEPAPKPVRDRLSFGIGRNGRWRISGELSPDDGLRIEAAIQERKDALFDEGAENVTYPEAFVDCFDRSLGAVESLSRRDHYRTWLHLDVTDGNTITTDGWHIPTTLRDRILCDGVIQPVWERDGIPFSVGRSQRVVPDRTRRIVEMRDRGCRVPGCTGRHVEIHHIIHWADGGTTDTWNLISLCKYHHKLHHQGELGISGNADEFDGVVFTDQRGERIAGVGTPAAPTDIPEPAQPYRSPLNGRFDWNWIGLGWIHPNAIERQRAKMAEHRARLDRQPKAA
jgi:hypothetical protein